jgi:flagellar hook-associated protein 3 FlgL
VDEDGKLGTVLNDLGITGGKSTTGATAWNSSATVRGASLFSAVIELRDALMRGDNSYVGGQGLGNIDLAMDNLQARLALNGSRQERVMDVADRLSIQVVNTTGNYDSAAGLNMVTAATDLSQMKTAQQAALQIASQMLPQSLLDFLR